MRIEDLAEIDPFITAVEVEYSPRTNPTWRVRIRRDRPIHLTLGSGSTKEAALRDAERMFNTR